jgi:hypothetical protein
MPIGAKKSLYSQSGGRLPQSLGLVNPMYITQTVTILPINK